MEKQNSNDPVVLYIILRGDLASLNPGKAVAQACHAANKMVKVARTYGHPIHDEMLAEWEAQGDGYGTTITLQRPGMSATEIDDLVRTIGSVVGGAGQSVIFGMLHDPTYPVQDGSFTHLIPLDTCAYVFGRKSVVGPLLASLPLMP